MLFLTAGEEGKRRRSQARFTRFQAFPAEAHESTRRHCFVVQKPSQQFLGVLGAIM
jgi:hypothetical protein